MLPPGFDPETGKLRIFNRPLPSGFDPATGRLRNTSQNINTRIRYTSRSSRWTWWDDFNNSVEYIGYWFANWIDNACNIIMWVIIGSIWLGVIIAVIAMFVEGKIVEGIISAIVGGAIAYYGAFIIGWIGWLFAAIILYGLRFLFWNAWSLVIALTLAAVLVVASSGFFRQAASDEERTEQSVPLATIYQCTASSLNVRSAPSIHSSIKGTLKRGDQVEVYDTIDGFAHIKYKGMDCYVSMEYLQKIP